MSLEQKCKLYFLVYHKLLSMVKIRSAKRIVTPLEIHEETFRRTNHILEPLGEKLTIDELFSNEVTDVKVQDE